MRGQLLLYRRWLVVTTLRLDSVYDGEMINCHEMQSFYLNFNALKGYALCMLEGLKGYVGEIKGINKC